MVPVGQLMSGCSVGELEGYGSEELFHVVNSARSSQVLLEQDLGLHSLSNAEIIWKYLIFCKDNIPISFSFTDPQKLRIAKDLLREPRIHNT